MKISRRGFLGGAMAVPLAFGLSPRPKLLVLVVAEQFRGDYFDSHAGAFGKAGFQRLLENGVYYPNCFVQSTSFTASGLATLSTGCYPSVHGIIADRWFDRSGHEVVTAKAELMEATTFAAQFRQSDPRNRVYGIGFESQNTAILSGGKPKFPLPDRSATITWKASGAKGPSPMRTIVHDSENYAQSWAASPVGQAAQFTMARETVAKEKLGRGEGLDLLCLSLGSLGAQGLEKGANSPLVFDLVSQLDSQMENFLGYLDEVVGENSYQIVFTAAHGIVGTAKGRVSGREIAGGNPSVEAYIYPNLYLRAGDLRKSDAKAACLAATQVAAWYTAKDECSHSGVWRQRFQNSFHSRRSGDAILAYAPEIVEDFGPGRGVSYGSIYNYDTRVPLIFYGPQFRSGEHEEQVELTDIAPTLARAMGTALPSSATGRVLGEAFAR